MLTLLLLAFLENIVELLLVLLELELTLLETVLKLLIGSLESFVLPHQVRDFLIFLRIFFEKLSLLFNCSGSSRLLLAASFPRFSLQISQFLVFFVR